MYLRGNFKIPLKNLQNFFKKNSLNQKKDFKNPLIFIDMKKYLIVYCCGKQVLFLRDFKFLCSGLLFCLILTGGSKAKKYHLIRVLVLKKIKLFLKMIDNSNFFIPAKAQLF